MQFASAFALASFLTSSGAAWSQEWRYKATFYGWFPGLSANVDTPVGTVDGSVSASDALSALDMAFMGAFVAETPKWSFSGDLIYTDTSATQATPFGVAFGDATLKQKLTALSGYALYNVSTDPAVRFDLGVGLRYFDLQVKTDLSAGVEPATSFTNSGSWVDPLLAARVTVPLNEKWFLNGLADFGGTGSDSQTWQVYGAVGYAFNEHWSTQFGYRYMDISKEVEGSDVDLGLSGVLIGATYSF
jgi:hypothetical protein